jgi:hypothetical protein
LTVSADILVCLALVGWTNNNTSLWEMEAVLRMFFVRLSTALLQYYCGSRERKQN